MKIFTYLYLIFSVAVTFITYNCYSMEFDTKKLSFITEPTQQVNLELNLTDINEKAESLFSIFSPILEDEAQVKVIKDILYYRFCVMNSFFAFASERARGRKICEVAISFLDNFKKLNETQASASPELINCLIKFDNELKKLGGWSYQTMDQVFNSYFCLNHTSKNYFYLYCKLYNDCFELRNEMKNDKVKIMSDNCLYVINKFCSDTINAIGPDAIEAIQTHEKSRQMCLLLSEYRDLFYERLEIDNVAINSFLIKLEKVINFIKINDTKSAKISQYYSALTMIKSNFISLKSLINIFMQQRKDNLKIGKISKSLFLENYFSSTDVALINRILFNKFSFVINQNSSNYIYPVHNALVHCSTEDKNKIAQVIKAIIKFTQNMGIITDYYQDGLNIQYILSLLPEDNQKKEFINLLNKSFFAQFWAEIQESGKIILQNLDIFKNYVYPFLVLLKNPIYQWNYIPEILFNSLREYLGTSSIPPILVSEYYLPYLYEIYLLMTDKQDFNLVLLNTNNRGIKNLEKIVKQFLSSQAEQSKNQQNSRTRRKKSNKRANRAKAVQAQSALLNSSNLDLKEKSDSQKPEIPEVQQIQQICLISKPKVKRKYSKFSWADFMRICEVAQNKFLQYTTIEHENNDIVILKNYRGYSSNENITLILYPEKDLKSWQEESDIIIEEINLPKAQDNLDNNWDYYHAFSNQVEARYLHTALVIKPGDNLAAKLSLRRLNQNDYALCIRAKFTHGYSSPEFALRHKDNSKIGVNGYIVYLIDSRTKECFHRFFHKI